MQELRPYLHSHRAWLSGLWTASGGGASLEGRKEQAVLLSQLLGSLLKICDPEVSHNMIHCLLCTLTRLLKSV